MFGPISCHFFLRREYFPESFIKKKHPKNLEFLSSILRHSVFAFFFLYISFVFPPRNLAIYINYDIACREYLAPEQGLRRARQKISEKRPTPIGRQERCIGGVSSVKWGGMSMDRAYIYIINFIEPILIEGDS